jgi:F-type H+-transporting ATPase subunit a
MLILVVVGALAGRNPQLIPGKLQNFVESILEFFLDLADSILQDRQLTLRVFPILGTLFLLIVLSNWLGLLPGVGTVGFREVEEGHAVLVPFLRGANADVNATLAWAFVAVITAQVFGVMALGFKTHASKYFNFKGLFSGKMEGGIGFAVGLLELFGELSRIISFAFRLFGNIFAGEVLLAVIAFLVPFIAPVPFYFLELFVGLIQGIVFVSLALVFIKVATISHDDHGAHAEAHS